MLQFFRALSFIPCFQVCLIHDLKSNCQFFLYITGHYYFPLTWCELSSLHTIYKYLSANPKKLNCSLCLCCPEFYELHPSKNQHLIHFQHPVNLGAAERIKLYTGKLYYFLSTLKIFKEPWSLKQQFFLILNDRHQFHFDRMQIITSHLYRYNSWHLFKLWRN